MEKAVKKYWPLFLLPTLAAFTLGFLVPFAQGLFLSFCRFTTLNNAVWNGLENYAYALRDPEFAHALWFTVRFTAVCVVLINLFGLALALALTRGLRGTGLFRAVYFLPNLIGGIVLGYIWQILLNALLTRLGQPLLALNPTAGFWGLAAVQCWQQTGYMMVIYIAGLQAIPEDYLEAARIDGANSWQLLWRIRLPNLMPSITICTFLTLTNSFKLFDQNLALTAGEPAHASELLALNIYNTFYSRSGPQWKGYGQAKAALFCLMVVALAAVQLRATRSREVQQ